MSYDTKSLVLTHWFTFQLKKIWYSKIDRQCLNCGRRTELSISTKGKKSGEGVSPSRVTRRFGASWAHTAGSGVEHQPKLNLVYFNPLTDTGYRYNIYYVIVHKVHTKKKKCTKRKKTNGINIVSTFNIANMHFTHHWATAEVYCADINLHVLLSETDLKRGE